MLCQCGCGNLITYIPRHKYYTPRYIYGHNFRKGYWTGKKRDLETVRKMSRSRLGKPAWNKGKKMLTPHPMLGRHHSIESRKKMSISRKGKPRPWRKGKPLIKNRGKNNPAWKGGVTPINKLIRNSIEYEEWRKTIFERDNYICQICGRKGSKLRANHIKRFADFPELRFELSNGIVICELCDYTLVMGRETQWESYFNFNLINRNIIREESDIYDPPTVGNLCQEKD